MKTWFITGASAGLGREYAIAALDRGDKVAAVATDIEKMQDLKERYGDQVLVRYLDATDRGQVFKVFNEAVETFGHIDVAVNAAGFMQCGAVEEMTEEEVRDIFDYNFFATLFVSQAAAAHMRPRRSGTIVQTSSLAGVDAIAGEGIYAATKFAVIGMSQGLYHELADFGVRVIIVQPGPIKTPLSRRAQICSNRIVEYDAILEEEITRWENSDEFEGEEGDPVKCASLLMKLVDCEKPPKHIVYTTFAYDILQEVLKARLAEADEWKEASASTDIVS